jgi:hypothetical protein
MVVAVALAEAWFRSGSVDPSDWLVPAFAVAFVLVTVLAAAPLQPPRPAVLACALLLAFAAWQALGISWSPLPADGRDQALLTLLYVLAAAVPLVALGSAEARTLAVAIVTAEIAVLAVATALELRFGPHPVQRYLDKRLFFPISYWNAQAAVMLIGFWPAVVLTARKTGSAIGRGLAAGAAVATLAGWLLVQSKGGGVGLLASAIVVFAVSPARLRLVPPTLIAAAVAAAGIRPLTAPFRASDVALAGSIRHAGATLVVLTACGVGAGAVYALVDRRVRLSERGNRIAGVAALAALVLALLAGALTFVSVTNPGHFFSKSWRSFKHYHSTTSSTHFFQLGSERYDFWRVAIDEFRHHPLAGDGTAGWSVAYLQQRLSEETPVHAHSLEFEVLSENGIVGFALLAGALGILIALAWSGTRRGDVASLAALGAGAYWLAHASVDWLWNFPSVGVPLFVLLGLGVPRARAERLPGRIAVPAAVAVAAVGLYGFGAPLLATKLTSHALAGSRSPVRDLHWARSLDPLSTDPLVAESDLAATPAGAVKPLLTAVSMEPRSASLQYLLGLAYLRNGQKRQARAALERANTLDPRDELVLGALRRAGAR